MSECAATRPRHPSLTWERTYPGRKEQASQVRAALRAFLAGCPAADDVILLASELTANAIAHSASGGPGGTFTVRVYVHHGVCIDAQVEDQGSNWDGQISGTRSPHGLYLLRQLSAACGTRRGQQGWITWFTIGTPATGPAPQP
jgi:two-component sensor histidine kinase